METFNPPVRTLMGPGPSDVHPRVLGALARPTIGHLDPEFIRLMDSIKSLLQYAFQTKNALTLPISAPGSAGMECCFANLMEPGDKAIVCVNGAFGMRMCENVTRLGGALVKVEDDWGQPVDPSKLEQALKAHPDAQLVALVHAETSTGVRSDAATLCGLASAAGALSIVDCVTALGGIEVQVDAWGADAVYAGSQKCLSCVPGLSPVTFSDQAVQKIKSRKTPVASWFLDLNLVMGYWGQAQTRAYHHTAPVNSLYALHEALLILKEEGLEAAWQRHAKNHQSLRTGLEALDLAFVVPEPHRLPQLNTVAVPEGTDEAAVRAALLADYSLEIGAGLGALAGKVWRIGLMGHSSRPANVLLCTSALAALLPHQSPHP